MFDLEYANLFDGIVLPNKNEITETEVKTEPNIDSETEELYLKYIQKAQIDDFDIDFSKVEEPKIEEKVETVEIKNEPIFKEQEVVEDNESKVSNDFDSVISSKYEYKSVLTKLFPKPSKNTYFDYDFEAYTQPKEEVQDVKVNVIEEENTSSLDELYELSEKENVKIRTSNDTNRYQGTKILSNKLRFHSSILLTVIAVLEYLLMTLIFSSSVKFETSTLLKIGLIFGSFTLLNGLIYLFRTNHSVKDLSKFINSFEIALVLTISVIIISICIASINSIDVYSFESVYNYIILPSVMAVNIPIFVLLMHFLSKLEIYQTV